MKIIFISFSDFKGGANIAAYQIYKSLNKFKKYYFFIYKKNKDVINPFGILKKIHINFLRIIEKIIIKLFLKKKFHQSLNIFNTNILNKIDYNRNDIINLHWVNRSMISLKEIYDIKCKVVITLHDMWFLSSTEHYSLFKDLKNDDKISAYCSKQKTKIIQRKNVYFIAHNKWMLSKFKKTYPKHKSKVYLCKYYPIDTTKFKPRNKIYLRRKYNIPITKKIILFSAQDTTDSRKGYEYFIEIVEKLKNNKNIFFISIGKHDRKINHFSNLLQIDYLSRNQIFNFYSLSDIYVCTSLLDNLPLTILEALSSGNVVLSFKNGGADEILSKLGYNFKVKDKSKLIKKLKNLNSNDIIKKSKLSRKFAIKYFSNQSIGSQYTEIFKKIC